jgi:hypothetical protein
VNIKPLLKGTLEESLKDTALTDYLSKDIIAHLRKTYGDHEVPQKFLFVAEDFTVDNADHEAQEAIRYEKIW